MTHAELREAYLAWTRRAVPALLLPLVLTALLQAGAASHWWKDSPPSAGAMRYLFIAVGAAAIMMGRTARARETAAAPLAGAAILSLSWRLVIYALAPATIGAILAFMTRELGDYYLMLLVTLVGLVMLYPRFDQWVAWSAPGVPGADGSGPNAAPDTDPGVTPGAPSGASGSAEPE